MPPPLGGSSGGLPSRVKYLSPQGVLLPLVYGTAASPLWLELRGHSAWQVTPSWTVYRLACHRLLPWLRVTFAMVPDAAWPGSDQWPWSTAPATGPVGRLGRPSASDPWGIGSFLSLGRPTCVQCPGQQRAHVQGVGVPDEDLTEDRGVGGKQYAMPGRGGGEEREDVRGPQRGGEHDVGRVRPRERCRGERDHRTAVYCEVPSGAMVEEPD